MGRDDLIGDGELSYQTLEDARKEAGLTQDYMAAELGIVRQTYARMEKNPELMTIAQAKVVCQILGTSLSEIVWRVSANGGSPEKIFETIVSENSHSGE